MQENKPSGFKTWLQEKGYYIVLVLCVAAVGISGYLYFTKDNSDSSKSVSVEAGTQSVPASNMTQTDTPPDAGNTDKSDKADGADKQTAAANTPAQSAQPREQQAPPEKETGKTTQTLSLRRPVDGTVQQSFAADHLAYNATTKDWRVHTGVDIAAEAGTQVCAAADGTVTAILDDDYLGKTVVVSHDGDYATRYSNLSDEVLVSVGDEVQAGQAIASIGSSALIEVADAPHLHFVVTKSNQTVDPEPLLSEQ